MSVEQNLPDLSTDLIIEIFTRLPSKSIARFCCLSKLWASLLTLGSPYFTELFLTRSVTRPRLFFAIHKNDHKWYLCTSPQPQNSYKNSKSSSLTVTAELQMSFPEAWYLKISPPLSGLVYYPNMRKNNYGYTYPAVCNPSTGQILWLPNLTSRMCSYFGYDPIDKQFSVLSISISMGFRLEFPSNFQILNLRSGELYWRSLTCPLQHMPDELSTCINGVLYYAASLRPPSADKIVCFDFKSEEFKFIDQHWTDDEPINLVNFKGKLCGIQMTLEQFDGKRCNHALRLWILDDFKKQEWSKHLYGLPSGLCLCNKKHEEANVSMVGVSVTGDIVLSLVSKKSYCVYFFNPEKNTLQEVEIKGLDEEFKSNMVHGFVDRDVNSG